MSRRYRDDDSGEYDRPRSRGNRTALIVVLSVIGVLFVGCSGATALYYYVAATAVRARPTEPAKKTWTRQEFRDMLMGKTKEEVLSLAGKPYETVEPGEGNYWMYDGITIDPINGKTDSLTWVRFNSFDVVAAVDF